MRHKAHRSTRDGRREIGPGEKPEIGEHRIGHAVARNLRKVPEKNAENDHRREWLEDRPENSEDGLFVADGEIATRKEVQKVAIVEEVRDLLGEPATARLDDDEILGRSRSQQLYCITAIWD